MASIIVMVFHHNAPLFRESKYHTEELTITQQVVAAGQLGIVQDKNKEEASRRSEMTICVVVMVLTHITLAAKETKEFPIYMRERLVKLRIVHYLLSKMTVLMLICVVQIFLLVSIVSGSL